jgi:APA family basic amino acid/polyamine antiporter
MSHDGLVSQIFSEVHPATRRREIEPAVPRADRLFGGFIPGDIVGEMTSIGTLFAFVLVLRGRLDHAGAPPGHLPRLRGARAAGGATLGILCVGAMIYGLGWTNWVRLAVWLIIGLFLYFGYARNHSRLQGA